MLTLRFLGGFEALVDGVAAKVAPAPARLLCRLAADANRTIPRNRIWQDLWPDSDASDVVNVNLRRLRNDILRSEAERLKVDHASVLLNLIGADVDFLRFQELVRDGSVPALEEAVRLYRGEFLLRYCEEGWALDLRDELKTDFEDALKTLAENALRHDDFLVAARHLRRFVESNPDYEWGWYQLIETYARRNNAHDALTTYAAYAERSRAIGLPKSPRIEGVIAPFLHATETPYEALAANNPASNLPETKASPLPASDKPSSPVIPAPLVPSSPAVAPWAATLDERLIVGGALPPDSPFYIARDEDAAAFRALAVPGATVRIKGPRQVGKSSLLARALRRCREAGMLVLLTDWQNLPISALESAEAFYTTLAYRMADKAELDVDPVSVFRPNLAPGDNFDRFIMRLLVPAAGRPIVWAIDEADRIFSCDFFGEVFAKLRAWHNERALDAQGPLAQFSLALSYSTEARLFIPNLNQSPFNVGVEMELRDFTPEQTAALHDSYGQPLGGAAALQRLHRLLSGHPYLTSRALYEARMHAQSVERLEEEAERGVGAFADHLERLRFALGLNPELAAAVRSFLRDATPPTTEQFVRLNAAGIVTGGGAAGVQMRCLLYERYLRHALV